MLKIQNKKQKLPTNDFAAGLDFQKLFITDP